MYDNRNHKADKISADVIIGPIANDIIYDVMGITTSGILPKEDAKKLLMIGDEYKQIVKTLTEVQLFYIIQDQFKKILSDKKERDKFIIQVLKDWYNNKISKNYSLSVY